MTRKIILLLALWLISLGRPLQADYTDYLPYSYESERDNVYVGIDISKFQHTINWKHVDTSLHFVVVKATEGLTLKDRKFDEHWDNIHPSMIKGAYHFFNPVRRGKEQARFFLSTVKFKKGHLAPVIDVEYTRNYSKVSRKQIARNLREMIVHIEKTLKVKPIIYTNAGCWDKYIAPYFGGSEKNYHLWIADYRGKAEPRIPKKWKTWSIWQHTDKARMRGINGNVDVNVCKVDLDKLIIR